MSKPYFLMKAQTFREDKIFPDRRERWFWSIKLDGMRAFWDGGKTRGNIDVPWCREKVATGLWTNNGNIIYAPDWFLNQLPPGVILDGELWAGIGRFQFVSSVVRSHSPDARWKEIKFVAYDNPSPIQVYAPRKIDELHCKINIDFSALKYFQRLWSPEEFRRHHVWNPIGPDFAPSDYCYWHGQFEFDKDYENLYENMFPSLVDQGHEGIMFRKLDTVWSTDRSWNLLKLKPYLDAEAEVIGVQFGREGKYIGMIGSLICKWGDKIIKMSGLTDELRELGTNDPSSSTFGQDYATKYPGKEYYPDQQCKIYPKHFRYGSNITFKYRELTNDGMPKDPRYYRKHNNA